MCTHFAKVLPREKILCFSISTQVAADRAQEDYCATAAEVKSFLSNCLEIELDQVHLACRTQDMIGWNWTDFFHLAKEKKREIKIVNKREFKTNSQSRDTNLCQSKGWKNSDSLLDYKILEVSGPSDRQLQKPFWTICHCETASGMCLKINGLALTFPKMV